MVLEEKVEKWWKWGHKKLKKIEKTWRFDYQGILFLKIGFLVQFPPNLFDFRVNFVIFFIFWKIFTFYLPKSGKNASVVNDRFGVAGSTNSWILVIFRPFPFQWKIITHPIINRFQRFFAWELYLNISFEKKYFKLPRARAFFSYPKHAQWISGSFTSRVQRFFVLVTNFQYIYKRNIFSCPQRARALTNHIAGSGSESGSGNIYKINISSYPRRARALTNQSAHIEYPYWIK